MRKTVLLLALISCTATAAAQFRWGVKGGANLSNVNMNINSIELACYKPRPGFHVGFMSEYMLSKHLGLHAELTYFNSGAGINAEQYKRWFDVPESISLKGYLNMYTFQLPLYVKTKFGVSSGTRIYLMGGGFVSYASKADISQKISLPGEAPLALKWSLYEPNVRVFNNTSSNAHLQRRWNVGVAAETGVEFNKNFTFGIGFRHVLNNMAALRYITDSGILNVTTQMWTATLSLGYCF